MKTIAKLTTLIICINFLCTNMTYAMEDQDTQSTGTTVKKDSPRDEGVNVKTGEEADKPATDSPDKKKPKKGCTIL
ncbi:MAG: hypothetical protein K2P93_06030 [Alphaproteobacteria bacterium]|nr:hypothetical protein [Alphaproteobacteria bacterium]